MHEACQKVLPLDAPWTADYMRHAGVVAMDTNWEPCLAGMLKYAAASECRRSVISR